mmetsp:Transcript_51525/g.52509  ORF Transcript_51525/g.52509 Transcript_51525/m.52509 type:complete len:352 (-) Transcript_51525:381-1436(-)
MLVKYTFMFTFLEAFSVSSGTTLENERKSRMDEYYSNGSLEDTTTSVPGSSSSFISSSMVVPTDFEVEDTQTQDGSWCPINAPITGGSCGGLLPKNASWGSCSYSKFITTNGVTITESQNCACTLIDPLWRCISSAATPGPVTTPTSAHIDHVEPSRCECDACTEEVWDTVVHGYSCGDRISFLENSDEEYLMSVGITTGPFNETEACRFVSEEFTETCTCSCESPSNSPSASSRTPSNASSNSPSSSPNSSPSSSPSSTPMMPSLLPVLLPTPLPTQGPFRFVHTPQPTNEQIPLPTSRPTEQPSIAPVARANTDTNEHTRHWGTIIVPDHYLVLNLCEGEILCRDSSPI